MSITYFLLMFLCISLQACNARHLSPLDKKQEKKPHFSLKISDEKKGFDSTTPKHHHNEGNDDKMMIKTRLVSDSVKRRNRRGRVMEAKGKASSGASLQAESLVSVSWRVPHKKPSEKNLWFNLDYSPPKTHPPSHN